MLIGLIALLLFGKSLPSVARNVGKQYHSFKRLITDASSEIRREMDAAADSIDKVAEETKKAADLDNIMNDSRKPTVSAESHNYESHSYEKPIDKPVEVAPRNSIPSVSHAAALDNLQRNIPPPTKIPPPVS